ncbi:MAG: hypothetical protein OHK0022_19250 [Roseiflexaceae bacterium]
MNLSKRPPIYELPSYSLTGDLIGFLRCGLQYRLNTIGRLPSARPAQAWFGQYIHGVLEEAYRRYKLAQQTTSNLTDMAIEINSIRDLIKKRLAAQRLFPGDEDLEQLGDARAEVAVNELGPLLFPLIHEAEVRITGARLLRKDLIPSQYIFREAERYEMVGVVDVITHVTLTDPIFRANPLVQAIVKQLTDNPPEQFEVIIDYKGMRRPPIQSPHKDALSFWEIYAWQTQTYAHLRGLQEGSLPVIAGVIIYLNELHPSREDMKNLQRELAHGQTDIRPLPGGVEEHMIRSWQVDDDPPQLPFAFRLQRALRVLPMTLESIRNSLVRFDEVVAQIETSRGKELTNGQLMRSWAQNSSDEGTCAACDARTFCPSYRKETTPRLPGIRLRDKL